MFLKIPSLFSRNQELLLQYSSALQEIKTRAGVSSLVEIHNQKAWIRLYSRSHHLVGAVYMGWNPLFYHIDTIRVSESNLRKGIARLLQEEAAYLAFSQDVIFRMTSAFSHAGKIAFSHYPKTSYGLLKEKIPLSFAEMQLVNDLAWKDPPVLENPFSFGPKFEK